MDTTAGVTCSAIATNALLASVTCCTAACGGFAPGPACCAYPNGVRLKPAATNNPPMNATAATTPTVIRVEKRDAIAKPNRVKGCPYYTTRRRQVSLPAAWVRDS